MSVYNGEQYLSQAIESILNQTFTDFEFLIINDGSTDSSHEILKEYSQKDRRIRIEDNGVNAGLIKSLNKGLKLARGLYIARMDADDISLPYRLEKQVAFMDTHPDVGICGSCAEIIGHYSGIITVPHDNNSIICRLPFQNSLIHPSVIIRKSILDKHGLIYDEQHIKAEDYGLWVSCIPHTHFANLPDVLIYYRVHINQESNLYNNEQLQTAHNIQKTLFNKLGIIPSQDEWILNDRLMHHQYLPSLSFIEGAASWINRLYKANLSKNIFPKQEFASILALLLFDACSDSTHLSLKTWIIFYKSQVSQFISFKTRADLFLRCCLGTKTLNMPPRIIQILRNDGIIALFKKVRDRIIRDLAKLFEKFPGKGFKNDKS